MAEMQYDTESGTEDEALGPSRGFGEKTIFDTGKTVIPVTKEKDRQTVLINPVDSYIGKYQGQYLSTKAVGGTMKGASGGMTDWEDDDEPSGEEDGATTTRTSVSNKSQPKVWKVLGTFAKPKTTLLPFLWGMVKQRDYDAYLREATKCAVIIYDSTCDPTPERYEEVKVICDTLRSKVETFKVPRVFIVISSLHTWSHTRPPTKQGQPFTEDDYRRRHTTPAYRELQLLERYVVASGRMTKGRLKAYVIGAGIAYGGDEDCLNHWFSDAWKNAKQLPVYGSGDNLMPTIYLQDLAKMVQNVMDMPPQMQRYLIAVDPTICEQEQIAKAISKGLGTGKVTLVSEQEIYSNSQLTTFQADQHLLDLKIESAFAQENFNMVFTAEKGFTSMIGKVCQEFKQCRKLEPSKVVILGPTGSGKTSAARQIAELYHLNHFTKEGIITNTLDMMKEMIADFSGLGAEDDRLGPDVDGRVISEAKRIVEEVDVALAEINKRHDEELSYSAGGKDATDGLKAGEYPGEGDYFAPSTPEGQQAPDSGGEGPGEGPRGSLRKSGGEVKKNSVTSPAEEMTDLINPASGDEWAGEGYEGPSRGSTAASKKSENQQPFRYTIFMESPLLKLPDDLFVRICRWRLLTAPCQNQGFILDGFPENLDQARMLFKATDGETFIDTTFDQEMDEGRDVMDPRLVPDRVVVLEASDDFIRDRLDSIASELLEDRHRDSKMLTRGLRKYRELNSDYEKTFLHYLDLQEIMYQPINVQEEVDEEEAMANVAGKLVDLLGQPRVTGLDQDEEEGGGMKMQKIGKPRPGREEDTTQIESREFEERRANIQQWMDKLTKIKREKFERDEAAMVPSRHYLMSHVVPTLVKGLMDVCKARPRDPVEYLAEFLFSNNPGALNATLTDMLPKKDSGGTPMTPL